MGIFDGLFKDDGEISDVAQKEQSDRELISFVKSKVDDSRNSSSRVAHEGVWMTNIAYLMGFDSVYYDTNSRQYLPLGAPFRTLARGRIHVNKILPTIQNRLSRLSKNRPKYLVKPNSSDNSDKEAARLSEKVLDMLWERQHIDTKRLELLMWVQQCGHAYLKVSWDPALGNELKNPEDILRLVPAEYEGDIRVDVVSPFEVFPDPLAKTLDGARFLVQAKVRHLDYFRNQYGEEGEKVKAEEIWLQSSQYEQRINNMGAYGPSNSVGTENIKNAAIELSYYEKRSPKHPNGRLLIIANNIVLENKELPTGEIPFAKFDDILIAGKYYSESVITHLRPVQDQYNRIISKRAEWANKMLSGKWIAAKGHNLIQEALTDESGEVIEFDPVPGAGPPSHVPTSSIPAYAYTEEQALDAIMNDISGINEVSRGQAPGGGVTAAIAFQYLSEQDDTRIAIVSKRIEEAMALFGSLALRYAGKFYKTPRLLKIAGQNMEYTVQSFVGADLKENYDVVVVEGSTLPGSLTAKRDFIMALDQRGYLGDPADPKSKEKILKMLEFGDVAEFWNDYGLDMAQIKKAIEEIKQGIDPPLHELDNHELYIKELNRYRKTDEFDALPPETKERILNFLEAHIQAQIHIANPDIQNLEASADQMATQPPPEQMPPDDSGLPMDQLPGAAPS